MKRKRYEFNEGMAGVVVAKSLKQAINILCKEVYGKHLKPEIRRDIKAQLKTDDIYQVEWFVDWWPTREKTGYKGWTD